MMIWSSANYKSFHMDHRSSHGRILLTKIWIIFTTTQKISNTVFLFFFSFNFVSVRCVRVTSTLESSDPYRSSNTEIGDGTDQRKKMMAGGTMEENLSDLRHLNQIGGMHINFILKEVWLGIHGLSREPTNYILVQLSRTIHSN